MYFIVMGGESFPRNKIWHSDGVALRFVFNNSNQAGFLY